MYPQNLIDALIAAIPPEDGAESHPSIFDLIQKAYADSKTDDMIDKDGGPSVNTKKASSPYGRGMSTVDDQPSSPLSVDDNKLDKLKSLIRG